MQSFPVSLELGAILKWIMFCQMSLQFSKTQDILSMNFALWTVCHLSSTPLCLLDQSALGIHSSYGGRAFSPAQTVPQITHRKNHKWFIFNTSVLAPLVNLLNRFQVSYTICMVCVHCVPKENQAMKTLLLIFLPGKTPATMAGTEFGRKRKEMRSEQIASPGLVHHVCFGSLHKQAVEMRDVYLCKSRKAFCAIWTGMSNVSQLEIVKCQ